MKVLIVGCGAVAAVLVHYLANDKSVSSIVCGDIDLNRARSFVRPEGGKVSFVKVDAGSAKEVSAAAKGCSVIVNASLPRFNLAIMQAALDTKANYIDLCSELGGGSRKVKKLSWPEQLEYNSRFTSAGISGLFNAGLAPGITNLMARDCAGRLDSVDSMKIFILEEQKSKEFILSWSADTLVDELATPPLAYRKGRFCLVEPFSEPESVRFPGEGRERVAVNVFGDELSTLPRYVSADDFHFKSAGTELDAARMLYELGLFSRIPVEVDGRKIVPVDVLLRLLPKTLPPGEIAKKVRQGIIQEAKFGIVVEAVGKKKGKRATARSHVMFPGIREIAKKLSGATYISWPTGVCAYAFVKALMKTKRKGTFPPECLDGGEREKVIASLKAAGVNMHSVKVHTG